jgi:hypothetical protein
VPECRAGPTCCSVSITLTRARHRVFTKWCHVLGTRFQINTEPHFVSEHIKPLTPNDPYRGRTAPLTSKRFFLCIYSTNIGTEYFKHGIYSPSFPLQNAVCFIILTYLVPVLLTFYIQGALKLKKIVLA